MSVLVYAESPNGVFKKAAFEVVTFAKKVATSLGVPCYAITIGESSNATELGSYGAEKVFTVNDVKTLDSQVYTSILAQAAKQLGAKILILPNSSNGKSIIGRLAVKLNAGTVTGVKSVPTFDGNKMTVSKSVFSGKATATFEVNSDIKILSVMNNSIPLEMNGSNAPVEAIQVEIPASKIKVLSVNKIEGKVPLPEASVVVSAGRGMKGPENWGIIEDLADAMGATTACSRPVADSHWRPHYEHVGQTGVAIRPNLYIAIGISGAIQHLAGVNNSKTIVVINKDSEAPFFKAADYGVCADLFEVVPKLTEAIKKFKNH